MKLDFGSGYNPRKGYLTCDFTSNPFLDFHFENYKIVNKHGEKVKSNSFDEIVCRNVLHHISNLELVIFELQRVLNHNGKLRIIEPNKDYFKQNVFLDKLWYRFINDRKDIWFSETYRDYQYILNKYFSSSKMVLQGEKEYITCFKKEKLK